MSQTIRITVTSDLEKALRILRQSTMGVLNTTELIKMAVGELAQIKKKKMAEPDDITPKEMDKIGAHMFYEWAKEDGTLSDNNISPHAKLKPFVPKSYVRNR